MTQGRPAQGDTAADAITDLEVLITAEEAYPALERAFLQAQTEISACFRVFDLRTRLRSAEARAIGATWFDLVVHTLDRGVAIRLVVSDFDPIAAVHLHRLAWQTLRQIAAVREMAKPEARLDFTVALHAAKSGIFPRLLLYPLVRMKIREMVDRWCHMNKDERERFRVETPRLRSLCRVDDRDQLCFPMRLMDLHPATHHQKLAVFDRRLLYIGGLDLNERRYDTKDHRQEPNQTWHDVQVLATGRVAEAAQAHLEGFLAAVARRSEPPPQVPGFLRTLSRRRLSAPMRLSPHRVLREIERAHTGAIASAERLIYLETQYFRHVPLARALARRAGQCPDLRLILVLPAAPEEVAFSSDPGLDGRFGEHQQARALAYLKAAFGPERLVIASPVQPRASDSAARDALEGAPLIYVHSKVSIFDEAEAIVSSANLNGRSMRWDTEAGLHVTRSDHVAEIRAKVMGCWVPKEADASFLDIETAFDAWRRMVASNSVLPPQHRAGFLVDYDSDAAQAIATPLPGMPEEVV
jgi:phospholipase D1/2